VLDVARGIAAIPCPEFVLQPRLRYAACTSKNCPVLVMARVREQRLASEPGVATDTTPVLNGRHQSTYPTTPPPRQSTLAQGDPES
jgi:hypothetical protein